jgi:hypothetical protein
METPEFWAASAASDAATLQTPQWFFRGGRIRSPDGAQRKKAADPKIRRPLSGSYRF